MNCDWCYYRLFFINWWGMFFSAVARSGLDCFYQLMRDVMLVLLLNLAILWSRFWSVTALIYGCPLFWVYFLFCSTSSGMSSLSVTGCMVSSSVCGSVSICNSWMMAYGCFVGCMLILFDENTFVICQDTVWLILGQDTVWFMESDDVRLIYYWFGILFGQWLFGLLTSGSLSVLLLAGRGVFIFLAFSLVLMVFFAVVSGR